MFVRHDDGNRLQNSTSILCFVLSLRPPFVMNKVLARLHSDVLCADGSVAYQAAKSETLYIVGPPIFEPSLALFSSSYSEIDPTIHVVYQQDTEMGVSLIRTWAQSLMRFEQGMR